MKIRTFTQVDWMAYAGCNGFPESSGPYVGEHKWDDGHTAVVIVDGDGEGQAAVLAYFYDDEGLEPLHVSATRPDRHAALALAVDLLERLEAAPDVWSGHNAATDLGLEIGG